jgi:hypothetical protein
MATGKNWLMPLEVHNRHDSLPLIDVFPRTDCPAMFEIALFFAEHGDEEPKRERWKPLTKQQP